MSRGLGGQGGAGDTRGIVLELAALRAERAALLGYPHHAALVAAESAARTTEAVSEMLARLTPLAMANAGSQGPWEGAYVHSQVSGVFRADEGAGEYKVSLRYLGPTDRDTTIFMRNTHITVH